MTVPPTTPLPVWAAVVALGLAATFIGRRR
jgi:hypothetical protein